RKENASSRHLERERSGVEGSSGSYLKGFATGSLDVARDDGEVRFVFSSASIFASGKQFTTSSFVSQPLRAAPMPNHKSCKRAVRWASGLITQRTPFPLASGHQRQSRSSRFGAALSSIQVPVSAAASSTAGISMAYPSRFNSNRPVGCASIVTNGFEIARMTRFVISASLRL